MSAPKRESKATTEFRESLESLRKWIKPGDTVYTILDHVSASGMSRAIRVVIPYVDPDRSTIVAGEVGNQVKPAVDFVHPNFAVGKVLGLRHWKRNGHYQDALIMGGCGMDMGFSLVYHLSSVLYPVYRCLGKGKCPSNYHVNHHDQVRCEGVTTAEGDHRHCYRPDPFGRWKVAEDWPRAEPIDIGEGQTIPGHLLACLSDSGEDGKPYEVCPTCKGNAYLPNPDGPERFDLDHNDGYALRHKWL